MRKIGDSEPRREMPNGRNLTGDALARIVGDFVNSHDTAADRQAFVEEITRRTHRTLQQGTMRLFVALLEEWAKIDNFDARNEATIKLAKKLISASGDKFDRHLPLI